VREPSPALARYGWFVVFYNLLVILWGAFVRATGSGAGCGRHWPLCNGEVLPRAPSLETVIEISHRISSGLDGFLVLALLIWAFRAFPRGHRVRWTAAASMLFLILEALVGAGLVRFELVVDDASLTRAVVMAFHLLNTFFLLATLTLTALWAGGVAAPATRAVRRGVRWALGLSTVGLLLVGMSGAVTALGDTIFPARDFAWSDLSATSHFLLRLRILHPTLSVAVAALVLLTSILARTEAETGAADGGSALARRAAALVSALVLVQLAVGFVNVQLAAPVWMQLTHLALADALWIAWVSLGAALFADASPGVARPLQ
jgi:heme A synthase